MFKSKKYTIITSILIVSMSSFSSAHSGRTDASGGHRDNKNKSGLGSYHYHCEWTCGYIYILMDVRINV